MTISIRVGKPKLSRRPEADNDLRSGLSQAPGQAAFVRASRWFTAWMQKFSQLRLPGRTARRLRVAETISLGEKRFVAIVEVDGMPLLLGGSSTGVVLLKELGQQPAAATNPFAHAMDEAGSREGMAWFPQ